jgi:hypothetical protein
MLLLFAAPAAAQQGQVPQVQVPQIQVPQFQVPQFQVPQLQPLRPTLPGPPTRNAPAPSPSTPNPPGAQTDAQTDAPSPQQAAAGTADGLFRNGERTWFLAPVPLFNPGQHPPVPPAGPPTTPPVGGCGCPHITPVAGSDKPDPGRAAFELSPNDLDWAFSNRLARFSGDWDKALLDLAHAIDKDGTLQLWTAPAPVADPKAAPLVEGDFSGFLIAGYPDPSTLPPAPHPIPGEDAHVSMARYLYGPARVSGIMLDLVATIARADKYGEPAAGTRDAALHWARFLIDDLSRMPGRVVPNNPLAQRISVVRLQAVYTLESILEMAIRPDPRWSNIIPREGRMHFVVRNLKDPKAGDMPANALALDVYDLASAALEIVLSIDDKKQTTGLLGYMGRPDHFDPDGYPLSDGDGPAQGVSTFLVMRGILEFAALHSRFGGPAPPGSPAEAVACKALSVLAGLAARTLPHSTAMRRSLWGWSMGQIRWGEGAADADPLQAPRYRAMRAAALLAGLQDAGEARLIARLMLVRLEQSSIRLYRDQPPPDPPWKKDDVAGALQSLRDVTTYATGPGRSAFTALVNAHLDRIRAILARAEATREPGWREIGALVPVIDRLPDTFPDVLDKGSRQQLIDISNAHLAAFAAAAPDISAPEWQALCPPAGTPPRVVLIARGASRDYIVDRLYPGVPTAIDLVFGESYYGDSYPVSIEAGGKLDLTALPVDADHLVYRTPVFLPGAPR